MKILILCTGNSCRSQMAQGFLQSFDKRLDVYSAGTNPSEQINQTAVDVISEKGIDLSSQKPKSVDLYLKDEWDYVITVCDEANETCPYFPGTVRNRLHFGFEDPSLIKGPEKLIKSEFRRIRDDIERTFYNFYKELFV
jgi:arsenate reductase (thioredoxin)